MAEDRVSGPANPTGGPRSSGTAAASSSSSSFQAPPPGHAIRRAVTVDETAPFRRRPPMTHLSTENPFEPPRRRSSNLSEYSLQETRRSLRDDLLSPLPEGAKPGQHEESGWASAPLAFALLPAVGGLLFTNGSAIVTDVMLLGFAGIFLHWSVTLPWYVLFTPYGWGPTSLLTS